MVVDISKPLVFDDKPKYIVKKPVITFLHNFWENVQNGKKKIVQKEGRFVNNPMLEVHFVLIKLKHVHWVKKL